MTDSSVRCGHPLPGGGGCRHARRRGRPDCGRHTVAGARAATSAAGGPGGHAVADPLAAPAVKRTTDLYSFDELCEGDRIDGLEVTGVRHTGDGVLVEFEHGVVDDREYGPDDGLIEVSRDVPMPSPAPALAADAPSGGRHVLAYSPSGATCSCGREFNVYKTRRSAGWSEAHDGARTVNIVKANARRHADAANRKL